MNILNSEGYPDPTAYEALRAIEAEEKAASQATATSPVRTHSCRPLVYICSPYAGDILNNERKAREYGKFAIRQGVIPVVPHLLYPQFLNERNHAARALGLLFGLTLLAKCEEIWVFGPRISAGMAKEIAEAERKRIPIRYFSEDCREVKKNEF